MPDSEDTILGPVPADGVAEWAKPIPTCPSCAVGGMEIVLGFHDPECPDWRTVSVPKDGNFWLVLPTGEIVVRPQHTVLTCGVCGTGYYESEIVVVSEGDEVVEWEFPCGHAKGEAVVDD